MNMTLPDDFSSKLAAWNPELGWVPFQQENLMLKESISGVSRLLISTSESAIELLKELIELHSGPFRVAYLLLSPPVDHEEMLEPARYEVTEIGSGDLMKILTDFQNFLETDARHHLWIHPQGSGGTLIYDEHNWIYAYGQLPAIEQLLTEKGFQNGTPTIPYPHLHNESARFNDDMHNFLRVLEWKIVPASNLNG
jgi:hypothetical protein